MLITVKGKSATDVKNEVIQKVLGIYPEEELIERPIFKMAIKLDTLEFTNLQEECNKMLIPWQLFFLEESQLDTELANMEKGRAKVTAKLFAKRKGVGVKTSKRILDRLIRCQNYVAEVGTYPKNNFCGSLKSKSVIDSSIVIYNHFKIDASIFRRKSKADALAYLIDKIESENINICQGVLQNKILPMLTGSKDVYKNTSGFVIQDECLPFIFIPSEVNPDEKEGRQIYTLIYLVTLIGLDAYEYFIDKDFNATLLDAKGVEEKAYNIASEFLLPKSVTDRFEGTKITSSLRDTLASEYKITPTAVVVILRKRNIIKSPKEYKALIPEPSPIIKSKQKGGKVAIENSVRKFGGKYVFETVNQALRGKKITSTNAQYLLLGAVYKKGFKKYKDNLGI